MTYAPVAGWKFSVDEGSKISAEPFLRWSRCACPISGPGRWWHPRIWMTPLQSQYCPWWRVGESRGVSPEVHYHLYSFERVELQVVVTAPDSQLLNLLYVSRLVTILDEANDCKLQEFDRGVFKGCSHLCRGRRAVGREHSPEEIQCC